MIKLLILYYLSIKDTHGYEIQKFIQINHMNEWNNIQSGSIYYAMSKLEKEGLIQLLEKVSDKEKSKKLYTITTKGKEALKTLASEEMLKPLGNFASDKFLIYPIVASLSKDDLIQEISSHITKLDKQKVSVSTWYEKKSEISMTKVEQASFELMLSNIEGQLNWHKILLDHIDETITAVKDISNIIKAVDFSGENIVGIAMEDFYQLKQS
jgi:DNA-binding PadR family transcriptional regulator